MQCKVGDSTTNDNQMKCIISYDNYEAIWPKIYCEMNVYIHPYIFRCFFCSWYNEHIIHKTFFFLLLFKPDTRQVPQKILGCLKRDYWKPEKWGHPLQKKLLGGPSLQNILLFSQSFHFPSLFLGSVFPF